MKLSQTDSESTEDFTDDLKRFLNALCNEG
jgi:hypothetical protein